MKCWMSSSKLLPFYNENLENLKLQLATQKKWEDRRKELSDAF
jgi:hypothetical protein